jgi:ATPase subunit of ABC transporter with duplicated ATPase domains
VEETLSFPVLVDYVNGLNFHLYHEELRLKALEAFEKEAEIARKQREEMERLDAQRRAEEIAERSRLAAEREALLQARKDRLQLLRMQKKGEVPSQKTSKKKLKFSEMQTKGIGKTHQSCCHESREVLDAAYRILISHR